MDSGFDLGVTSLQSKVDNSGRATIPGLGSIYGFGASSEGESLSGNTTLVSARYKWNNTFIGGEYLMGGKNVFNYDPSTEVANGFYSTPGTGTHAYVLHKLAPELALRVGYMKQDYKSTPFTFGASGDTDRTITTVYTNLRLVFVSRSLIDPGFSRGLFFAPNARDYSQYSVKFLTPYPDITKV